MAKNELYIAVGKETTRGTKEATTVGFLPIMGGTVPANEPEIKKRDEFRGEASGKGNSTTIKVSNKWSYSPEIPVFTDAGSTNSIMGTVLKHFFGRATSVQNGATGQYAHTMSPHDEPYDTTDSDTVGTEGLTVNANNNEGLVMKNRAFSGGRVTGLNFSQETGQSLMVTPAMIGQKAEATTAEIGSPTFAPENLRCDFHNLTAYFGTVTHTGSAPDYTDITFGSATSFTPDSVTISLENGLTDRLILDSNTHPTKSSLGKFTGTLEMTFDFEDPSSGFSSVDEYNTWIDEVAGDVVTGTNFAFHWDTGTVAGTAGDNYGLIIDLPNCIRTGGSPEYALDTDTKITLSFDLDIDATTTYAYALMLKNEDAAL